MRNHTMRVVLIMACLLLLAATQSVQAAKPQAAKPGLPGTRWVLSSLNGQLPLAGTTVTLQFAARGAASGTDGCNRFTTTYTVRGSTIHFRQPAAAGLMACPLPVMDQGTAFMQALGDANKYEQRSNQLTLLDGAKVLATFIADRQDLAGTKWMVVAYNNGRNAVTGLLIGTDITASFDKDDNVEGSGGCNDFLARYQTSDGAITIGNIGATRKSCALPPGIMEQESEFFAALRSAATYTVEGNFLEMRDADDAIAVHFQRELEVPVPPPAPSAPSGRVTAPNGVNIRSGPGVNFPVLGSARFDVEGEIVGRSADGRWWVAAVPSAPGGLGWVSADFVAARDADDVPVIASPPAPVFVPPPPPAPAPPPPPPPTPAPWPTATPGPRLSFRVDRTTINQGECTTLHWSVENVQAVWVYPQGRPYQSYPRTGQGSEQVCPPTTTTYEMRVLLRDGSVQTQRVTVNVTPAAPQNPLNGTAWQVTGYYNGRGGVVGPLGGTTLTARFDAQQISGNGGCNNFSGPYHVSGSNISIGTLASGFSLCVEPAGIMEQENEYLTALRSSSTFRFDGNRLEFRRWDGTMTVVFSRLQ
jgi:heat shock protein HslJ